MAWLFVWTFLHLLSLLTTAQPLDALHLLQYILFFAATLLLGSGVLLMENEKNCFKMPACDRRLYSLCWSERTDWGMVRGNQSFLPNIRLKPTEQENLTQYLIFDHFGKYTVHVIQHLHMYACMYLLCTVCFHYIFSVGCELEVGLNTSYFLL